MTFIFDTFFGSTKRIYRKEFNQALSKIPAISKQERDYLNEVFKTDLSDGLTSYELKQRIAKLERNSEDILDYNEVEQVKKKLIEKLGGVA